MPGGYFTGRTSNEYISTKIVWLSVADRENNSSTVTAALYYKRNNTGYTTSGTGTFTIYINGVSTTVTKHLTITESDWVKAVEATRTITHDFDGSKTISLSASGSIPDTSLSYTTVNERVKLETIPRAAILNSVTCSTKYFNGSFAIGFTPTTNSHYVRCVVELKLNESYIEVKKINLGANTATLLAYPFSLSEDELSVIYNKFPSATQGTLRFTLRTYFDSGYSSHVGDSTSCEITLSIPSDASTNPSVSMSLDNVFLFENPFNTLYIQGHSRVKANLGIVTKYGATVVASNITVNGNTYDSPYESDILSQPGKVSVKATVKDSRGYYGTNYKDIEVIPYIKPYVSAKSGESSIIAARCDSSANFTDSGTYLKIKAKVVYSKVMSGGVQNNYGKIKFRYRKEGGTYSAWQTILECKTNNSDEVITPPLLNGALDIKSNYQVQIIASDYLYDSDPVTIPVPSDAVYMHRPAGGKSMGLGGYSSADGNLDIHWNTKARGGLSLFDSKGDEIPLGSTLPLPRDQIKGEWNPDNLECGVHVVANNNALKSGDTVIMYNGVLIQMKGDVGGNVKVQLALPVDTNRNPMYRLCWYSNWSDWRSMKI